MYPKCLETIQIGTDIASGKNIRGVRILSQTCII